MSGQSTAPDTRARDRTAAIRRLLFVSDAAVAGVHELPSAVRAIIDAAAEVHVLTPTLTGRLALARRRRRSISATTPTSASTSS